MENKSSWDYITVQVVTVQKMNLLPQNFSIKIGANLDFWARASFISMPSLDEIGLEFESGLIYDLRTSLSVLKVVN